MIRFLSVIFLALATLNAFTQDNEIVDLTSHFMVFSDPHYYDPSLGTEGEAFKKYLDGDRKLLKESKELLAEAIGIVQATDAEFILIPGDLTKDGTKTSHENFASMIQSIEDSGKPVFVIPGNHDISNGESNAYQGDKVIPVENVDPNDFEKIYWDYGYGDAIYRDSNSLSYVIEPVNGLWVFALDASLYRENEPGHHPETDGEFHRETIKWIEGIADKGREKNKLMFAFMHHGIIEHYQKQDRFFGEYVVNKYKRVSRRFADAGINVVFTGHYHSQDVTIKKWRDGDFVVDVETGSLVTYPCPLREVRLKNNELHISSMFIENIPSMPEGFVDFSREYVHSGIAGIAEKVMISMWLRKEDARKLSGQIGDAFIEHYEGDEPSVDRYLDLSGVGLFGKLMILTKRRLIKELYSDLHPADNEVIIDLETGNAR
ncbi:MAG: metallophosphoesterase [Bacteroidales bacterium]|nr:metallophosphoesterase [Bacteroidales bacterium]